MADRLLALLTGRSGGDVATTIRWWEARDGKIPDPLPPPKARLKMVK